MKGKLLCRGLGRDLAVSCSDQSGMWDGQVPEIFYLHHRGSEVPHLIGRKATFWARVGSASGKGPYKVPVGASGLQLGSQVTEN